MKFLPLIFRMKHIKRWGLMQNTRDENLSEHSLEVALIANLLSNIGNTYFGKSYNAEYITTQALFHDAQEILTGDLPTPIKYYNKEITKVYKNIENEAKEKLLKTLPKELTEKYVNYFEDNNIIKAADKLAAYIKCKKEINAGNKEFIQAEKNVKKLIEEIDLEELNFFLEHCMPAFELSLDELTK